MSSDLGFQTLCNLGVYILFAIAQRSARPWSHGYVPLGIPTHVFRSLLNALVACIGKDTFLFAVQQIVRLSNIVFIRGGSMNTVDYRRAIINADMRLHAKVPLITFLGGVHLRITTTTAILRGGRSMDDGRIYHRTLSEE